MLFGVVASVLRITMASKQHAHVVAKALGLPLALRTCSPCMVRCWCGTWPSSLAQFRWTVNGLDAETTDLMPLSMPNKLLVLRNSFVRVELMVL